MRLYQKGSFAQLTLNIGIRRGWTPCPVTSGLIGREYSSDECTVTTRNCFTHVTKYFLVFGCGLEMS